MDPDLEFFVNSVSGNP